MQEITAFRVGNPAILLFLLPFTVLFSPDGLAQENDVCVECHGQAAIQAGTGDEAHSLFVNHDDLSESVHEDLECIDCHMDLEDGTFPCEKPVEPVDCTECHDEIMEVYGESFHGQVLEQGDPRAPTCSSCHGHHTVRAVDEPETRQEIHEYCSKCHETQAEVYGESLHGVALVEGDPLAPTCTTCHGGHEVLSAADSQSPVFLSNIPRLCGSCHKEGAPVQAARDVPHEDIFANYSQSIHGEGLFKKGLSITAVCTSCHTSHHVLAPDNPKSTIHHANITATCTECHLLIEEMHRKVIEGVLWEEEPHKIPVCVDCHAPHKARKVFYDQGMADRDCLSCHADESMTKTREGKEVPLFVDYSKIQDSMHSGVACAQCHTGGTPSDAYRPCSTMTEKVDCSICHEEEVEQHGRSVHGNHVELRDLDAPDCADCHDPHQTRGKTDPLSPTFPGNIPDLCGSCHREGETVASRKTSQQDHILANYSMSIHGKGLLESGLVVTAVCTDCHTAHLPLAAENPESSIHPDNVAATCARCHHGIYEQFATSIHATGEPTDEHPLPGCYDCHASHTITRTDVAGFGETITQKCGRCHEDVAETYFETYHGKAARLGSGPAARCHDCHGAHDVLPPTDIHSSLSRENIVATCQQCHEEAHRRFAGYLTHATHHNRSKYPFLFYTFWGMTLLLVSVLSMAILHTLLWLWRSFRLRKEEPPRASHKTGWQVTRFTPYQRTLHLIMLLSFLGLATTGMTVKFAYTQWAQILAGLMGGIESAAYLHRLCAILTFGYFFAHLFNLAVMIKRKGWRTLIDPATTMLPTANDLREVRATWAWFFGKGKQPSYGRWTYWEKFDYWAVFWGVAIIGSTGLMLWFPEFFTRLMPGEVLNVAMIIHSDEALLAVGFIFTAHFFNTHFRPGKFPMDPVIFSGTMPLEEFKKERRKEYEEKGASLQTLEALVPPRSATFHRGVRIFGMCALALGLTMIALILYAMTFGYR